MLRKSALVKLWVSGSLAFALFACGSAQDPGADLKVANGKVIDRAEYPSVILLFDETKGAFCTGTFISEDTVLTAAHCTMGGTEVDKKTGKVNHTLYLAGAVDIPNKKVEKIVASLAVYRNPVWDDEFKKQQVNKYDLGVVVFPKGYASKFDQISSVPTKKNDLLTIVGFGLNYVPKDQKDVDPASAGIKRKGTNKVMEVSDGFVYFSGQTKTTTADGTNVNSSMGDSGGPMFINGKLAGVTSGGGIFLGMGLSLYIDLQSQISKDFLGSLGFRY